MYPLIILCFITSFFTNAKEAWEEKCESKRNRAIIYNFLDNVKKKIELKHDVSPAGTVVGAPGWEVWSLGLHFQVKRVLTKEEARKMLIEISKEFLYEFDHDEKLRPLLIEYPLPIDGLDIALFIRNTDGSLVQNPEFSCADVKNGNLCYYYRNLETNGRGRVTKYKRIKEEYETWEEALILAGESDFERDIDLSAVRKKD